MEDRLGFLFFSLWFCLDFEECVVATVAGKFMGVQRLVRDALCPYTRMDRAA